MKKSLNVIVLLSTITFSQPKAIAQFSYPPEWEPHAAVWMSINDQWMDEQTTAWQIGARMGLAKALSEYVPLKILTNSDSLASTIVSNLHQMGADTSQISTIVYPLPNFFIRDTGPIFLTNGSELKVAN